jgi:hypothetical protein
MLVDVPSGWQFGFPKPLPDPYPENLREWVISQGYPRKWAEAEWFYFRWIGEGNDEVSL